VIAFWGYDAFKATLSPDVLAARDPAGATLIPLVESYGLGVGVIMLMTLAFLGLVGLGLRLKDRST